MYKQLTSEQRSQIFVLLQKKIKRKEIALLVGCSQSTLSREIRHNSTDKGNYLWDKAQAIGKLPKENIRKIIREEKTDKHCGNEPQNVDKKNYTLKMKK